MRSKALWVVALVSLSSACGGDGGRSLTNQNPGIGIENPNLTGDQNALSIIFKTTVADNGAQTFTISASMPDRVPAGDLNWSNASMIGEHFLIKIGNNNPLSMSVVPASGSEPASFQLDSPASISDPAAFMGLHNVNVSLLNLSQQPLGQGISTPSAIRTYPATFPVFAQRILSNCAPNHQPDYIPWQNTSAIPFRISFSKSDGTPAMQPLSVADTSAWQLTPAVFQSFFTPAEINELETPQAGIGYGADAKPAKVLLIRSTAIFNIPLNTNPQRSLPVVIQAREEANYQIEYQGGCSP